MCSPDAYKQIEIISFLEIRNSEGATVFKYSKDRFEDNFGKRGDIYKGKDLVGYYELKLSESLFTTDSRTFLWKIIFIIIINLVAILLILRILLKRLIANRIKKFSDMVDQFSKDEYCFPKNVILAREFSSLYYVLNNMAKKIQSQITEINMEKNNAEEANKEKSRFLANMSHELRTPMHAIMSFSSLGLKNSQSAKVTGYLEKIHISGERLTKLLDDLLDLSKLEAGKMTAEFSKIDLYKLTQACIDELDGLIQKKNLFINFNSENELFCELDKKMIHQVIINLLSNAIKYSLEETEIEIRISPDELDTKKAVRFSIKDEGIGIPKDELKEVFDSFIQSSKTRSVGGGTGLGLPISHEIISLHKGTIWADSEEHDKGSTFTFLIPEEQLN